MSTSPVYVNFSGRMMLRDLPTLGEKRKFIVEATCIGRSEDLRADDEECMTAKMKMSACYEPGFKDPNDKQDGMVNRDGKVNPDVVDGQVEEPAADEPVDAETVDAIEGDTGTLLAIEAGTEDEPQEDSEPAEGEPAETEDEPAEPQEAEPAEEEAAEPSSEEQTEEQTPGEGEGPEFSDKPKRRGGRTRK